MEEKQKNQTYEESFSRLKEIVEKLEKGDLSLEDSLSLFGEGIELVKKCSSKLDEAQGLLEKLTQDENGKVATEPVTLEEIGK